MEAKICHISYFLPSKIVTNQDLSVDFPEQTPEQIFKKTGVRKRTHTTPDVIGSDMAFLAAKKLFKESGKSIDDVGFLIFVSEGNDYIAPATGVILQDRLGLPTNICAIDIPLGCSGFTHSLGFAKMVIESGQADNVLLLFGDTPSFGSHPKDFALRSLFSDAGAAVWVEKSKSKGVGEFIYGTDGAGVKSLYVERSGFRNPIDKQWLENQEDVGGMPIGRMRMDGTEIFTFSLKVVPQLVANIVAKHNLKMEEIDLFVFHQASNIILKSIQRKLRIPEEKMAYYLENFGNTVSMSIPIALSESAREGRIGEGSKVLVAGFGIGYSWSGTVLYF
jgi:3-oxoacyl-[acyl-carrier-protein] synthase III